MFQLAKYDEVSSTNELVKAALREGRVEGYAVSARTQSGGYGRRGHAWSSPEGGLYMSLLLRPRVESPLLSTLSLLVALALRRAIAEFLPAHTCDTVQIKWPNDLVISAQSGTRFVSTAANNLEQTQPAACGNAQSLKQSCFGNESTGLISSCGTRFVSTAASSSGTFAKLSGISLESCAGGVCVGVGVNVFRPAEQDTFSLQGKNRAAYLEDLGFTDTIDDACERILQVFEALYSLWQRDGIEPFLDEYAAHDALFEKDIYVLDDAGEICAAGRARGIDTSGRLLVYTAPEVCKTVSSGEIHLA